LDLVSLLDFGFQKNLLDGFRILVLIEFNQSTSDTKLLTRTILNNRTIDRF